MIGGKEHLFYPLRSKGESHTGYSLTSLYSQLVPVGSTVAWYHPLFQWDGI